MFRLPVTSKDNHNKYSFLSFLLTIHKKIIQCFLPEYYFNSLVSCLIAAYFCIEFIFCRTPSGRL